MKNHWTFFLLLLLFCTLLTPGADAASKNPDKEFTVAKAALSRLDADKGKARGYRDDEDLIVSRKTIENYRKELEFPSARERSRKSANH